MALILVVRLQTIKLLEIFLKGLHRRLAQMCGSLNTPWKISHWLHKTYVVNANENQNNAWQNSAWGLTVVYVWLSKRGLILTNYNTCTHSSKDALCWVWLKNWPSRFGDIVTLFSIILTWRRGKTLQFTKFSHDCFFTKFG